MKLIVVACFLLAADTILAADSRPNILLIAVDDLRDTLGCYGNAMVKTPHIDRLAARGVQFERAYVQYPVCNASRTSFLTGLRPDQTGVTDNATLMRDKLPDVVTFPQLLKEHGRVLDTLDRLELWDNTVVIFLGDHGYHLGERNWWNKNTLFDRSCRAPLIIAAPGVRPGTARGLVEFVDLYPTIADLCGVTAPAGLAGQSLRPLLADPTRPAKPAAFTIVTRGQQRGDSIRTDRWRYTEWSDGARELYDHGSDPEETRNVLAQGDSGLGDSATRRLVDQLFGGGGIDHLNVFWKDP